MAPSVPMQDEELFDAGGLFDAVPGVDGRRNASTVHLCGTFGCTKPNNHPGLHEVFDSDGRGGRRGGSARGTSMSEAELASRSQPSRSVPTDRDFSTGSDPPHETAEGEPSPAPAEASAPAPGPESKPAVEEEEENPPFVRVPLVGRDDLCKKLHNCQRTKNHPGACHRPSARCVIRMISPGDPACMPPPSPRHSCVGLPPSGRGQSCHRTRRRVHRAQSRPPLLLPPDSSFFFSRPCVLRLPRRPPPPPPLATSPLLQASARRL